MITIRFTAILSHLDTERKLFCLNGLLSYRSKIGLKPLLLGEGAGTVRKVEGSSRSASRTFFWRLMDTKCVISVARNHRAESHSRERIRAGSAGAGGLSATVLSLRLLRIMEAQLLQPHNFRTRFMDVTPVNNAQ
jgi:hypothetical protein